MKEWETHVAKLLCRYRASLCGIFIFVQFPSGHFVNFPCRVVIEVNEKRERKYEHVIK